MTPLSNSLIQKETLLSLPSLAKSPQKESGLPGMPVALEVFNNFAEQSPKEAKPLDKKVYQPQKLSLNTVNFLELSLRARKNPFFESVTITGITESQLLELSRLEIKIKHLCICESQVSLIPETLPAEKISFNSCPNLRELNLPNVSSIHVYRCPLESIIAPSALEVTLIDTGRLNCMSLPSLNQLGMERCFFLGSATLDFPLKSVKSALCQTIANIYKEQPHLRKVHCLHQKPEYIESLADSFIKTHINENDIRSFFKAYNKDLVSRYIGLIENPHIRDFLNDLPPQGLTKLESIPEKYRSYLKNPEILNSNTIYSHLKSLQAAIELSGQSTLVCIRSPKYCIFSLFEKDKLFIVNPADGSKSEVDGLFGLFVPIDKMIEEYPSFKDEERQIKLSSFLI